MQTIQGQLFCQVYPKEHCCAHGYFGKDLGEKELLAKGLLSMSEHFKEHKEYLVPSLNKGYAATKKGLQEWRRDIWAYDQHIFKAVSCDFSSCYKESHGTNHRDFFSHLVSYVECPVCRRLDKEGLPTITNPKTLLRSFYRELSEPTNVEVEELDALVDKLVEDESPCIYQYKDIIEAKKRDPHACVNYVKVKRRKEAREKLKDFLVAVCRGRPVMREDDDPGAFGLSESSGSSCGSRSTPAPGDYSLLPTRRKTRSRTRKFFPRDRVLGVRASNAVDALSLGPANKSDRADKEEERVTLIKVFTRWKSRRRRIDLMLQSIIENDYPDADDDQKTALFTKFRVQRKRCDEALSMSKYARGDILKLMTDGSSDDRSDTST